MEQLTQQIKKSLMGCDTGSEPILFFLYDPHHQKTDLNHKVFVVVVPKEGLACRDPANPSLGMANKILLYCFHYFTVGAIDLPKEGLR